MNFNPSQMRAIETNGHTFIIAGPGSGKTKTIVGKVVKLLNNPDYYIGCVTFTRDAAQEIQNRILNDDPSAKNQVQVATFHSMMLYQLKRAAEKVNLVDNAQNNQILYRALAKHGLEEDYKNVVKNFDLWRIEQFATAPDEYKEVYKTFLNLMKRNQATDLFQMVEHVVDGMKEGLIPPLPFDVLFIDEFQDSDSLQVDWIKHHADNGTIINVVGDEDQSLYSFRNALGIEAFSMLGQYIQPETVVLDTNYRSHEEILKPALEVIQVNEKRFKKRLDAFKGPGGKARAISFVDKLTQYAWVTEYCLKEQEERIAIIGRNNTVLDELEQALIEANIEYHRPGQKSFWSSIYGTFIILAVKALYQNSHHDIACWFSFVGSTDVLVEHIEQHGMQGARQVAEAYTDNRAIESYLKYLNKFQGAEDQSQKTVLSNYLRAIKYSVAGLNTKSIDKCACMIENMYGDLIKLMDKQKKEVVIQERVTLITMHGSKGLEFPSVIMVRCEDGVIPSRKSTEIEEERRLFYVAMTRAEEKLFILGTNTAHMKGVAKKTHLTPFLAETKLLIEEIKTAEVQ